VSVQKPAIVLVYRRRADSFFGAARDLEQLEAIADESYWPAIGLLAVHGCIALADAVLIAVEGTKGAGDNHGESARRLRAWCSAKQLVDGGIKHFEWLLAKKNHFSYDDRVVRDDELQVAKVKMDQFFAWALRTFPAVAEIKESTHA
jgi:hypothetical protein